MNTFVFIFKKQDTTNFTSNYWNIALLIIYFFITSKVTAILLLCGCSTTIRLKQTIVICHYSKNQDMMIRKPGQRQSHAQHRRSLSDVQPYLEAEFLSLKIPHRPKGDLTKSKTMTFKKTENSVFQVKFWKKFLIPSKSYKELYHSSGLFHHNYSYFGG